MASGSLTVDRPARRRTGGLAGLVVFVLLLSGLRVVSLADTLAAALPAAAAMYLGLSGERRQGILVAGALASGAVSLATTWGAAGGPTADRNGAWGLLETAALLGLIALVVRSAESWAAWAVLVPLVAAQMLWITRFVPSDHPAAIVGATASWGIGSLLAIAAGMYPRLAARRIRIGVASAQAQQHRQLERDLHDYVAHDLSAMIVQAQAASYAASTDPTQLVAALERIAEAGHKAMTSMDRALELLRSGQDLSELDEATRRPTLEYAADLVGSFRQTTAAAVSLTVTGELARVPPVISTTLLRVLVEGLTNVRRHAPAARTVAVAIEVDDDRTRVSVANDGLGEGSRSTRAGTRSGARRAGGTGIDALRIRVEALGGTVTTLRAHDTWLLDAQVPGRPDH